MSLKPYKRATLGEKNDTPAVKESLVKKIIKRVVSKKKQDV